MPKRYSLWLLLFVLPLWGCGAKDLDKALEQGATQVPTKEIRRLLAGSTVKASGYGQEAEINFQANGRLTAENSEGDKNKGIWKTDKEDRLCLEFQHWGEGDRLCYLVYKKHEELRLFNSKGMAMYRMTILRAGNLGEPRSKAAKSGRGRTKPANADPTRSMPPPRSITDLQAAPQPITPAVRSDLNYFMKDAARDCPGCNLAGTDLSGVDLRGANLAGANLAGANLHKANLRRANLQGANLFKANLTEANLRGADLTGANLRGADLNGAARQGMLGP